MYKLLPLTLLALVAALLVPGPVPAQQKEKPGEPPDLSAPDPAKVVRFGPAYRHPQAGWIVVHIEGEPYDRGYQHGRLLPSEIAGHLRCFQAVLNHKSPAETWRNVR